MKRQGNLSSNLMNTKPSAPVDPLVQHYNLVNNTKLNPHTAPFFDSLVNKENFQLQYYNQKNDNNYEKLYHTAGIPAYQQRFIAGSYRKEHNPLSVPNRDIRYRDASPIK